MILQVVFPRAQRTKALALAALVLCAAVLVAAKLLEAGHPWLGFVAAFAEAAIVGRAALDDALRDDVGVPEPRARSPVRRSPSLCAYRCRRSRQASSCGC